MGDEPLVNSLVEEKDLDKKEETYPLVVEQCQTCGLVQIVNPISTQKIYRDQDYLYYTGDMPGLGEYFHKYARDIQKRFLDDGVVSDLIVEIGSNDGTMLKFFPTSRVLGVDPATNVVIRALAHGIPSVSDGFSERVAESIKREFGEAKVIYGNNCIAHIDDLRGLLRGVDKLLTDDGVFIVECNYWGGMVKNKNYSLIYHDHFSYFTARDWYNAGVQVGLEPFDAVVTPAQGGSLRIFLQRKNADRRQTKRYKDLVQEELDTHLRDYETCTRYEEECQEQARSLRAKIREFKDQGKTVAGYGAAAKGFSILSLAGITDEIDFFVDDSPAKQGKFTPVNHIPVLAREKVKKDPDVFVITAPNYAEIIKNKEKAFKGEWITP